MKAIILKIKKLLKALLPPPVKVFNRNINKISSKLELLEEKITKTEALSQENVWAHIFNNSIINSKWLNNKSFSSGRWAVGYAYLYVMYRVLDEIQPKKILELGLGQTTRMIAQYAEADSAVEHIVVEHDESWISFFSKRFSNLNNTEICLMNIQQQFYKGQKLCSYEHFAERFAGKQFDFISIDAPFGRMYAEEPMYSRVDIIELLPGILSSDFVIMIDDVERSGEKNTIKEIENILTASGIKYREGIYHGMKDCVVICAEHLGFLTTM